MAYAERSRHLPHDIRTQDPDISTDHTSHTTLQTSRTRSIPCARWHGPAAVATPLGSDPESAQPQTASVTSLKQPSQREEVTERSASG